MQVYLCIEGSGSKRAELIRELYDIGKNGEQTKFVYPNIKPEVMASLSELLNQELTVSDVNIRVQKLLQSLSAHVENGGFHDEEMDMYAFYLNRVVERNKKMLIE